MKQKEVETDSDMSMDIGNAGPCGNVGWCTQCSTLSLKEN